jgi:D-amino-acid dehydrogenase
MMAVAMRVGVIGAGIVGLACAFHLARDGHDVTVVDRDPEGDRASFGNAGGIAVTEVLPASVPGLVWRVPGWLVDPLGPLSIRPGHAARLGPWLLRFLRSGRPALMRRSAAALASLNHAALGDLRPMLQAIGLERDLRPDGCLTVYRSATAFARDGWALALQDELGMPGERLSGDAARELEPALSSAIAAAVYHPQWAQIADPRRLVMGLAAWLEAQGVAIRRGAAVGLEPTADGVRVRLAAGEALTAERVVVAAGAWSAALAKSVGDPVLLESERGYNTTIASPGIRLCRQVTFAEAKFVASPLDPGLRIGGAAEFAGLDAPADFARSKALAKLARRYLPGLRTQGGTAWMGQRPSTPDSLPVLGPSPRVPAVLYAFGHGHLGLTQAATTGRVTADLVAGRDPGIPLEPYGIGRFA